MKLKHLALISTIALSASVSADSSTNTWQTIAVAPEMTVTDETGTEVAIKPACAIDTIANPADGSPIPNDFQFYFKEGKAKKLVVFFSGGGACWNDETCVSSLALNSIPGQRSTYNPTVHNGNSPIGAGGIFDDDNSKNPFRNWSKVFIPYCTGDIHIGSNTKVYQDLDGSVTGVAGAPFPIEHRGYDNFLAVRDWLTNKYEQDGTSLKKMLVSGSSAGGYGATFLFPSLKAAFPNSLAALMADGSNGVVTQGFIDEIFVHGGNWNVENTLPEPFASHVGQLTEDSLASITSLLAQSYPNDRFGGYTTAFDTVQVQFLKIMDQLDQGNRNPLTWGLTPHDGAYVQLWNQRMETAEDISVLSADNYQSYIGAGTRHTVLTDTDASEAEPQPFYDERSAEGVKVRKWTKRMVKRKNFVPLNVKYSNE